MTPPDSMEPYIPLSTKSEEFFKSQMSDLEFELLTQTIGQVPDLQRWKQKTLVFPLGLNCPSSVLLGMKKTGFGSGKFNGFGGKVEPNESIMASAIRELEEECGLITHETYLRSVGTLYFIGEAWDQIDCVHVFTTDVSNCSGEIIETKEMKPKWTEIENIPYSKMWEDDKYWLPLVIEGWKVTALFLFDKNETLILHNIRSEKIV